MQFHLLLGKTQPIKCLVWLYFFYTTSKKSINAYFYLHVITGTMYKGRYDKQDNIGFQDASPRPKLSHK